MKRIFRILPLLLLAGLLLLLPQGSLALKEIALPEGTESVDLNHLKRLSEKDIPELTEVLNACASLRSCDMSKISMTPKMASAIVQGSPQITFHLKPAVNKKKIDSLSETLDLDDLKLARKVDLTTLRYLLSCMQNLKEVVMTDARFDVSDMEELLEEYPLVSFRWTVHSNGMTFLPGATAYSTLKGRQDPRYTAEDMGPLIRWCPDLLALDLGHNNISDLTFLKTWPDLRRLIVVDSKVPITDISPLADLKDLEYVELFMQKITDLTPLAGHTRLLDLNLCHNNITDLSPLYSCTSLERLWISYNPDLTQEEIDKLKAALPSCQVEYTEWQSTGAGWREHPRYFTMYESFTSGTYIPFENSAEIAATPEPTATPEPVVTEAPTPESTATPEPVVTEAPTPEPTATPEPVVTEAPTPEPTATPEPVVTEAPTPEPTATPEPVVTEAPTPEPTATPEPVVTEAPTPEPTATPEPVVTEAPTPEPTATPEPEITEIPASETAAPSDTGENSFLVREEESVSENTARNISKKCSFNDLSGAAYYLTDGTYAKLKKYTRGLRITAPEGEVIGALFVQWERDPVPLAVQILDDRENWFTIYQVDNCFYAQYIPVPGLTTLRLIPVNENDSMTLSEVRVLTPGDPPADVQIWQNAGSKVDIMLFTGHPDDELLWFGGTLPYYGGELGKKVLVVCAAMNRPLRHLELLDALWACGVRTYPVFLELTDLITDHRKEALAAWGGEAACRKLVTGCLRQYKPNVLLLHDKNGEYGHGIHKAACYLGRVCAEEAADASVYPEQAEELGTWDVPKIYIHLYTENQIIMDWNQPLSRFGGRTGIQVAIDAMDYHKSQTVHDWEVVIGGQYDNSRFGLYRSLVGPDTEKNDFLENIPTR